MRRQIGWAHLLCIASCLFAFVGCKIDLVGIEGARCDLMRYEPNDDSFEFLHSWTNIYCKNDGQLDHLRSLWNRRDSIVVVPIEIPFSVPAIQRLDRHKYVWIDLSSPKSSLVPEEKQTDADLSAIHVAPGPLYLNRHGNLCYVHQVTIPGKTLDGSVKEIQRDFLQAVFDMDTLDKEFEVDPAWALSWDDFRRNLFKRFDEEPETQNSVGSKSVAKPQKKGDPGFSPLDETSRQRLKNAIRKNSIVFNRNRDELSWTIPFSTTDVRESIATLEQYRKKFVEYVRAGGKVNPGEQEFINAFSLMDQRDAGLKVTLNFSKYAKAAWLAEMSRLDREPDVRLQSKYAKTVDWLKQHDIPVEPSFDVKALVARYQTN